MVSGAVEYDELGMPMNVSARIEAGLPKCPSPGTHFDVDTSKIDPAAEPTEAGDVLYPEQMEWRPEDNPEADDAYYPEQMSLQPAERLYTQADMDEARKDRSFDRAACMAQLHAARYTYHKQICKRYGDQVTSGQIPVEQGRVMYVQAMANYDGIIASAVHGHLTEPDQADMDKGFPL